MVGFFTESPAATISSARPVFPGPRHIPFVPLSMGEGLRRTLTRTLSRVRCARGLGRRCAAREAAARAIRALGALALAAAIAGCAAREAAPLVRPLMVRVPVLHETPCPVPSLADPALPLAALGPGSPPADTMRAYAASVALLKGAVRQRDAVLAGCARAAKSPPADAQPAESRVESAR